MVVDVDGSVIVVTGGPGNVDVVTPGGRVGGDGVVVDDDDVVDVTCLGTVVGVDVVVVIGLP